MQKAAAEGKHVGRPLGSGKDASEVLAEYPLVVEALGKDLSLRAVAKDCRVSVNTVRKVKAALSDEGQLSDVEGGIPRKAPPKASLPLRYTAAYIHDWRRYDGKHGELLVCGHFFKHSYEHDEALARRCEVCAKENAKLAKKRAKKNKGKQTAARVSDDDESKSWFALSLLDRPYNSERDALEVIYYRPVLVQAFDDDEALRKVRRAIGWRETSFWDGSVGSC